MLNRYAFNFVPLGDNAIPVTPWSLPRWYSQRSDIADRETEWDRAISRAMDRFISESYKEKS